MAALLEVMQEQASLLRALNERQAAQGVSFKFLPSLDIYVSTLALNLFRVRPVSAAHSQCSSYEQ